MMPRPRLDVFAACLAWLAGYVDGIGVVKLGGLFVSFMSGNTTQFGAGLALGEPAAWIAARLIAAFVAGVMLGTVVAAQCGRRARTPVVLLLVGALLGVAGLLLHWGRDGWAVAWLSLAMGAENAALRGEGGTGIGVTYVTGTLVKMAERLAAALLGGPRLAWVAHFTLWFALVLGAASGAYLYPRLGPTGLFLGAGVAWTLGAVALAFRRRVA